MNHAQRSAAERELRRRRVLGPALSRAEHGSGGAERRPNGAEHKRNGGEQWARSSREHGRHDEGAPSTRVMRMRLSPRPSTEPAACEAIQRSSAMAMLHTSST